MTQSRQYDREFDTPRTVNNALKLVKNVAGKILKFILRLKADTNASTQNPDTTLNDQLSYAGQLGGGFVIFILYFIYRYIIFKRNKQKELSLKESYVIAGSAWGTACFSPVAKILTMFIPDPLGNIVTTAIGFICAFIGATLYLLRPSLAKKHRDDEKKDVEDYRIFKLWMKVATTVLSASFALIACAVFLTIGCNPLVITIATMGGFIVGSILGFTVLPKLHRYIAEKFNYTKLLKHADVGYAVGGAIGGAIGAFIGTCIFPVIGTTIGGLIGAALGAVIVIAGNALVKPFYDFIKDPNLEVAFKVGSAIGTCIGAILGTLVFPGLGTYGGMMAGAALGTAVALFAVKMVSCCKEIFTPAPVSTPQTINPAAQSMQPDAPRLKPKRNKALFDMINLSISVGLLFGGFVGGVIAGPLGAAIGAVAGGALGLAIVGVRLAIWGAPTINYKEAEKPPQYAHSEKPVALSQNRVNRSIYRLTQSTPMLSKSYRKDRATTEKDEEPSKPTRLLPRSASISDFSFLKARNETTMVGTKEDNLAKKNMISLHTGSR